MLIARRIWTNPRCRRLLPQTLKLNGLALQRWHSSATLTDDITPTLLARAQAVAKEHNDVKRLLATTYDPNLAKRLGQLGRTVDALDEYKKAQNAWKDLQALLEDSSTDAELRALGLEDVEPARESIINASRVLKTSLIPDHPFAHLPCLLEIRPGAGGSEAALFASDLLRMYTAYCTRVGLSCTILSCQEADLQSSGDAPLQEAVLEMTTPGAYGRLRCEAGVHRVQRIPATESKGRTHTSAVSVLVLPSANASNQEEQDSDLFAIDPRDVRVDIMRARGAGGQHVNTTNSAVRLTHLPTNTVVAIQDSRSQPKNREKAWTLLRAKIAQQRREAREEEMTRLRRSVVGVARMGRGDKVRTYNWNQQRVTDHRSGINVHDLDGVLEGGEALEKVMDSVRAWLSEQDVLDLTVEEESKAQNPE